MLLSRRRGIFLTAGLVSFALIGHLYFYRDSWRGLYYSGSPTIDLKDGASTFKVREGELPTSAYNFTWTKPAWLAPPPPSTRPLVLRIAFITHPKEIDRRTAIRELMLADVPANEVQFEHLFFAGIAGDAEVDDRLKDEAAHHGDIRVLDLEEKMDHLSRKRFDALLWGANTEREYDYFVTADSDAFIRLAGLARRLRGARPDLDPRKDRIVWGHMLHHWWHWQAGVDDPELEGGFDVRYDGDWYRYPIGMLYLISRPLVDALHARADKLAHRIRYACDDVMVGSWVQELGPLTESLIPFFDAEGARAIAPNNDTKGEPIIALTTHVIDDQAGAHDPPEHGWKTFPVDWDTICVHHVKPVEMLGLRRLPHFRDEWTTRIKVDGQDDDDDNDDD